jgi:hypothetical protein
MLLRKCSMVLLNSILALCGDENGESVLGLEPDEEDRAMAEAANILPACVSEIAAYWRKASAAACGVRPARLCWA